MGNDYITMEELRGRIRRRPYVDSAKKVGSNISSGAKLVGSGIRFLYLRAKPLVQNAISKGNTALNKIDKTVSSPKAQRVSRGINRLFK